jgi:nitrile hydratase
MNSIHDLGGMDGFALPERDPAEPVFKYDWERLVFGSYLALKAPWSIDESRYGVERIPPDLYLTMPYYARWMYRNEQLLVKYGLLTAAELDDPDSVVAADPPQGDSADATSLLASKVAKPDIAGVVPSFAVGDRVVVRNEHPLGHTRAPRYVRGRAGVVQRDQGVHIFPDTNAMGLGAKPQHCYSVMFTATQLWGSRANPRDRVFVDLFDDYLVMAS